MHVHREACPGFQFLNTDTSFPHLLEVLPGPVIFRLSCERLAVQHRLHILAKLFDFFVRAVFDQIPDLL